MLYLINVPQWTTAMPPVALTCLAGYFEKQNILYQQIDINIKLYNYIFKAEYFDEISNELIPNMRNLLNGRQIDYNQYLALNIEYALDILKNKEKILDKKKLGWSNKIISDYLNMINQYITPVKITLNSMSFGIDNINTYTELINFIIQSSNYNHLIELYIKILSSINFEENALIGFSINNISQLLNAIIITRILKEKLSGYFFVGGSYISANLSSLIKCDLLFEIFDNICVYDGEHAISNLYNYLFKKEKIIYKNNIFKEKRYIYNKSEYYIEDINELPPPSYKGIDFSEYLSPIKIISLPISRGCYGSCTFCSYNYLASSKWREQSISKIIDSIRISIHKYHSNFFFFSVATLSPRMAKELSEHLIKEKIKIYWASGIRMETAFSEEIIEVMAKAGCVRLDIGIESACQEVLNSMNKRVDVSQFKTIINNMHRNGILPYLYIIKNFPTESFQSWKKTMFFLEEVSDKILGFSCYDFFLSPNTNIYFFPNRYGVEIKYSDNLEEDVIEKIEDFTCKFISENDKKDKDILLENYYKKNNKKFIHYGNAYIEREMPLTFPNQMLYITQKQKKEYKINENTVYILDKSKCIFLGNNEKFLKIFSLQSGNTILIPIKIYKIICNSFSVKGIIENKNLSPLTSEHIKNIFNKLFYEGILCLA